MKKSNKKGFTLVELVVVVAVLLILAAIAIPTVINLVEDANKARDEANARSIETAIKYAMTQIELNGTNTANFDTVAEALTQNGLDAQELLKAEAKVKFCWISSNKTVQAYTDKLPEGAISLNVADLSTLKITKNGVEIATQPTQP